MEFDYMKIVLRITRLIGPIWRRISNRIWYPSMNLWLQSIRRLNMCFSILLKFLENQIQRKEGCFLESQYWVVSSYKVLLLKWAWDLDSLSMLNILNQIIPGQQISKKQKKKLVILIKKKTSLEKQLVCTIWEILVTWTQLCNV